MLLSKSDMFFWAIIRCWPCILESLQLDLLFCFVNDSIFPNTITKLLLLLLKQSTTLCCAFYLYINSQYPLYLLGISGMRSCLLQQKLNSLDSCCFFALLSVVNTSFQFRQVNFKLVNFKLLKGPCRNGCSRARFWLQGSGAQQDNPEIQCVWTMVLRSYSAVALPDCPCLFYSQMSID